MTDYDVQGRFIIMDKATGKTVERIINTTYNSGNIPSDEGRIIRKSLKRILANVGSLTIPAGLQN
jgi:hypothetical protein